ALSALLSGYVIDATGYGLHHVASQTLVRYAGIGHGPANAAMLPHTLVALARRTGARLDGFGIDAVAVATDLARRAGATHLPEPPASGHWASRCEQDPFAISLDDKLAHLLAVDAALAGEPRVVVREASCQAGRTRWAFASTDGAACTQETVTCGGGLSALAVD